MSFSNPPALLVQRRYLLRRPASVRVVCPLFFVLVSLLSCAVAPAVGQTPRTAWSAVGAQPLSDSRAAGLITRVPESRPRNAPANRYVPTDSELYRFRTATDAQGRTTLQANPLTRHVTGRPGLTDPTSGDLVQWAAHKWGIPEDWIRAQMAIESWWNQSQLGDRKTVDSTAYWKYPSQARVTGTREVFQSMGVMQIKWRPDGSVHPGTEPLRWKSTAFNLDYYGATVRYYYDGLCNWCGSGYRAGQAWASVGAWYSPYPWNNAGARGYAERTKTYLYNRVWAGRWF